jgi:photosystem II stability/assembly factor-like uncharacterized protein
MKKLVLISFFISLQFSFAQWQSCNNGLTEDTIRSIAVIGNNLYAATIDGIFVSTNNGDSWTAKNNGLNDKKIFCIAKIGDTLFAGTENAGMQVSTDNGNSWIEIHYGLSYYANIHSIINIGNNIIIGTNYGIWISTNSGYSWNSKNNSLYNIPVRSLTVSGNNLYAGAFDGVYLSTDSANTWEKVSPFNYYVNVMAINGNNIFAGTNFGIRLSTDNGKNWSEIDTGLTDKFIHSLAIYNGYLFAGTEHGGLFLSFHNGKSWVLSNNGITNNYINSLAISGGNIYAGTFGGGIFRTDLLGILGLDVKDEPQVNNNFSIYPNPVHNILNIDVWPNGRSPIQIQIFDMFGQKVIESQIPAGDKDCKIDMEGMPTGIYILNINDKISKILKY